MRTSYVSRLPRRPISDLLERNSPGDTAALRGSAIRTFSTYAVFEPTDQVILSPKPGAAIAKLIEDHISRRRWRAGELGGGGRAHEILAEVGRCDEKGAPFKFDPIARPKQGIDLGGKPRLLEIQWGIPDISLTVRWLGNSACDPLYPTQCDGGPTGQFAAVIYQKCPKRRNWAAGRPAQQ